MSATITLTVDVDDAGIFNPGGVLHRVAELYRALLADGYDAEMETEIDEEDFEPPDPRRLN